MAASNRRVALGRSMVGSGPKVASNQRRSGSATRRVSATTAASAAPVRDQSPNGFPACQDRAIVSPSSPSRSPSWPKAVHDDAGHQWRDGALLDRAEQCGRLLLDGARQQVPDTRQDHAGQRNAAEIPRQPVHDPRALGRQRIVLDRRALGQGGPDRIEQRLLLIRRCGRLLARFGGKLLDDPDVLAQRGKPVADDRKVAEVSADAVERLVPALRELIELAVGELGLRAAGKRTAQQDQEHAPTQRPNHQRASRSRKPNVDARSRQFTVVLVGSRPKGRSSAVGPYTAAIAMPTGCRACLRRRATAG